MFHTSQIGSLGNGQGFDIPEVDKLLDEALKEPEQSKRAELYKQALKLIVQEYARVDYSNEKVIYGLTQRVQGFELRADSQIIITSPDVNVWLKK
jgi:peptide/nickel transport system substrate-binding protein